MNVPRPLLWWLTICAVFFVGVKTFYSLEARFFWSYAGIDANLGVNQRLLIDFLIPHSPAAQSGLAVGDEVVSPSGAPFSGWADYMELYRKAQHTQQLTISVRKPKGELHSYTINLARGRFDATFAEFCVFLTDSLLPLITTIIGLFICWSRWDDGTARTGGLFFLALTPAFNTDFRTYPADVGHFAIIYSSLAFSFLGYLTLAFFSEFPVLSAFATRWRWVRRLYLVIQLLLMPVAVLGNWAENYSFSLSSHLASWIPKITAVDLIGFVIPLLIFLPSVRGPVASDQARRFFVIILGIVFGFLPTLLLALGNFAVKGNISLDVYPVWVNAVANLLFLIFPLSFAYAIVKYRVLGVQQILRRSVQYIFLSKGILVIEFILLYVLAEYPVSLLFTKTFALIKYTPSVNAWVAISCILMAVGAFALFSLNPRLQKTIDRAFFRDAYQAQQVLTNLSQTVRHLTCTHEVFQRVAEQINLALHVNRIAFLTHPSLHEAHFAGSNGELQSYICRFDQTADGTSEPDITLPASSLVLQRLSESHTPLDVYPEDLDSGIGPSGVFFRNGHPNGSERTILQTLHSNLLVPLAANNTLLGFMSLGPKLSEEPYTDEDKHLLLAVAEATSLRLENTQLIRRITEEATLKRELEIAQQLQQSLLPSSHPALPGFEVTGYSTAANDVGGDYYDHFLLGTTRLAVAIGDVTGHGVSSGLLMALAKGGLLTLVGADASPQAVMSGMNKLICMTGGKRNLMTFAYAILDSERQTLELANAGHPFPYHYRAANGTVEALEITAYPLGVRPNTTYGTLLVHLAPGDAVVFYSDGIVEAQNNQGTLFGFDGLEQTIVEHGGNDAVGLRDAILETLRRFVGNRAMDDDVTVMVLRASLPTDKGDHSK